MSAPSNICCSMRERKRRVAVRDARRELLGVDGLVPREPDVEAGHGLERGFDHEALELGQPIARVDHGRDPSREELDLGAIRWCQPRRVGQRDGQVSLGL